MSSSEEEEFNDDDDDDDITTDFEDEFDTTTDEEDDDDDDDNLSPQPVHFRECLRLLDAALSSSNPPILPRWCASEQIGTIDDPMLLINGTNQCLSLPLDKHDTKKFIQNSQPLDMKIDLIDGISFLPTAHQIPADHFQILNPRWKSKVEPYLKQTCIAQSLQLNPNEIDLKISNLILLESCQFPRQFHWTNNGSSIAKLFLTLPSFYHGGKETIKFYNEKHVFDLSEYDSTKSSFYTIVPTSNECKHEIDYISNGSKLILVYDIIPLTSTVYYNVHINELILPRVSRICETWLNGLENDYHGYAPKIVLPFSDTFTLGNNPLLHGIDRLIGTILRRMIEDYHSEKILLYQSTIQPNRSNDGTIHACRLLTDMNLINKNKSNTLFDHIDFCLGNCNETYSGNIFLRKTRTEQGNLISIEQFAVPVWCLVPVEHKYDLLIDNLPRVLIHLEENLLHHHNETFLLINWLLTTSKKIHFNTKYLLHQLLRLSLSNPEVILTIRQLFEHKKFLEQFFPMNTKEEYDDIIYLLNYTQDAKIPLYLHQVFRTVLKRRSRDTERIKDAIKFIGVLSTRNIDSSFILVLIHELLSNIFKPSNPIPSITDLTNLLSLLSLSVNTYQSSCEILSQQIIRQIKVTTTTTTSISTITNLLRAVLIPALIQIYQNFLKENHIDGKRKRRDNVDFPSWFLSLYQTCLSLLNSYCDGSTPIPIYDEIRKKIDRHCCSICFQLNDFFENKNIFERTFLIRREKLYHFNTIIKKFHPLIIQTKSMTSDKIYHQIHLVKISNYDEDINRENNLLRSLLLNKQFQEQSNTNRIKRFKSS